MNADDILPKAILFDMDGTLTEPLLDFPRIKADMGIGNRPILEALAEMNDAERAIAEAILCRHEEQAAALSILNPGCIELLDHLSARNIPVALITRNSRQSVETVLSRHRLTIEIVIAREDAPPKPNPEPLQLGCDRLGLRHDDVWMVGDGQYDIEAGVAAGIRTVWLSHGRAKDFAATPWRQARDLWELGRMLGMNV
jgi:HAD superfamily hydrolase (TIGR01549 family)